MKAKDFECQYSAGQLIVERGSEVRQLFIVRSGNVVLDRDDGSEPRLIGSGQVFGELPGVLGSPSPYRAEADEDATVLVLDGVLINKMCDENTEFAARLPPNRSMALSWPIRRLCPPHRTAPPTSPDAPPAAPDWLGDKIMTRPCPRRSDPCPCPRRPDPPPSTPSGTG